jgi:hypothetical protein
LGNALRGNSMEIQRSVVKVPIRKDDLIRGGNHFVCKLAYPKRKGEWLLEFLGGKYLTQFSL